MTAGTTLIPRRPGQYGRRAALPDPPKPLDAMQQSPHIFRTYAILDTYFRHRPDVLVGGRGYLCHDTRDRSRWVRPDCLVDVRQWTQTRSFARNGYVISEVGKLPEFVLEVASESTGRQDYTAQA